MKKKSPFSKQSSNADSGLSPELEEFAHALAKVLVSEYDRRRQELMSYAQELRDWLDSVSIVEDPAVYHEIELRKIRIKQLLGQLVNRYGDSSDGEADSLHLRSEISRRRNEVEQLIKVLPLAQLGQKFKNNASRNRKPGPIRAAIARALARHPKLKTAQLWELLKANPPRGWSLRENPRLGKYIEGPKASEHMEYARFGVVCSEERKKLKRQ